MNDKLISNARSLLASALLLSSFTASFSANAQDVYPAEDLQAIEVGGVRIGQSVEEALEGIAHYFSINVDDVNQTLSDYGNPLPSAQRVYKLKYASDSHEIRVGFVPDLDEEASGFMVVDTISLEILSGKKGEFEERVKAANESIGPHSVVYFGSTRWCAELNEKKDDCHHATTFRLSRSRTEIQAPEIFAKLKAKMGAK